ncbi:MAG: radical SAM protein [Candidatus Omnitrophica bacterium]|nr:radical SAM protein [Candidatus Omnitrophota bacterium]
MDELRIDSHKLIYHVGRVSDWLKGKDIYPVFLDVSPTSACNHRCVFCGLDFARRPVFLGTGVLEKMARDAARHGVKSIMYAGEGEPLLHKDMARVIRTTKNCGIDVALNTNGALMDKKFLEKALPYLTWLRVSIDAGTAGTYKAMHRAGQMDFDRVFQNLEDAVRIKNKKQCRVTVGTQFLLLKENAPEAGILAARLAKIGVDYLIIKPYSKHPLSSNDAGTELDYTKMLAIEKKFGKYQDGTFRVIFRRQTMEKRFKDKPYLRCLGAPFWAYISATGDVYPCHTFLGVKRCSFGTLNDESFTDIWKGERRKKVMRYFRTAMDARKCRELCRLDEINRYLWQLTHPHAHVNFI